MARRPDQAKRRQIARRAFSAVRARGVHKTSMSDIAAALEMKRPTLYWYFRDLGEIFDAVARERDDELRAFVLARLTGVEHPLDLLAALVRASFDFYANRLDELVAMFQLWAVSGQDAERERERTRALVGPARAELVARLRAGVGAGLVAECDPEAVVELVLSAIDGALIQRLLRGVDPRRTAEALSALVLEPLRRGARNAACAAKEADDVEDDA